jgi:hypothetical protein
MFQALADSISPTADVRDRSNGDDGTGYFLYLLKLADRKGVRGQRAT